MSQGIVGAILAGGRAHRMGGGDKGLLALGGRAILDRVIGCVRPQVARLVLNANGDPARFAAFGLPVVPDLAAGDFGPLVGVLSGMEWAAAHEPACPWIATVPSDTPFLPDDLVARLRAALDKQGARLASVASAGRTHPVVGLWPVALRGELRHALIEEGLRKVDAFTARYPLATVEFAAAPVDPFLNVNTAEDLARAERLLAATGHP